MYNAEMGPVQPDQIDSQLNIITVKPNEYSFHANRYYNDHMFASLYVIQIDEHIKH